MTSLAFVALGLLVAGVHQAAGCKNCVTMGKEEKAMFRAHWAACRPRSGAESGAEWARVAALLRGSPPARAELPALRRLAYCVLLRAKLVGKDGRLRKPAARGHLAARPGAHNATKELESCAEQAGDSPEERAWNLFRCGYDKKTILFHYMPAAGGDADLNVS